MQIYEMAKHAEIASFAVISVLMVSALEPRSFMFLFIVECSRSVLEGTLMFVRVRDCSCTLPQVIKANRNSYVLVIHVICHKKAFLHIW